MKTATSESYTDTVPNAAASLNSATDKLKQKSDAHEIGDAIAQIKSATQQLLSAFSDAGIASGDLAKLKAKQGKERLTELSGQAEQTMSQKPLLYVGLAFAGGLIASRLMK